MYSYIKNESPVLLKNKYHEPTQLFDMIGSLVALPSVGGVYG